MCLFVDTIDEVVFFGDSSVFGCDNTVTARIRPKIRK